jgi:hypothetical protein
LKYKDVDIYKSFVKNVSQDYFFDTEKFILDRINDYFMYKTLDHAIKYRQFLSTCEKNSHYKIQWDILPFHKFKTNSEAISNINRLYMLILINHIYNNDEYIEVVLNQKIFSELRDNSDVTVFYNEQLFMHYVLSANKLNEYIIKYNYIYDYLRTMKSNNINLTEYFRSVKARLNI